MAQGAFSCPGSSFCIKKRIPAHPVPKRNGGTRDAQERLEALLGGFAAQDYTLLGTVLEFLANNSALPHAEALPGAWDAKAGTYMVTDASRAAVQTFLSVSPASGNDVSLREP